MLNLYKNLLSKNPFVHALAWPLMIFLFLSLIGSRLVNKSTLFLGIFCLLILHYKSLLKIGAQSLKAYGLLLLILWALISISWSLTPLVSVKNVTNDLGIMFFSLMAAYSARNKDINVSIKLTFMIVIFLLTAYCFVFPGDAISPHGLKSFYGQKNNLGFTAGLGVIVILMTFKQNLFNYLFLFISCVLLIFSQSKTSIILVILISGLVCMIYGIQKAYEHLDDYTQGFIKLFLKAILIIVYVAIGMLVIYRESIADYLIANFPYDALTGRGKLWVTVLTRSRDDLLYGLGSGSFWGADLDSEINQTSIVYQYPGWVDELISADGGYIDVIGAIGFIGLSLLLVAIVQAYKLNFELMKKVNWKLYFSILTFLVLHNITETGFFKFTYVLWFLFMFLSFYLVFMKDNDSNFGIEKFN